MNRNVDSYIPPSSQTSGNCFIPFHKLLGMEWNNNPWFVTMIYSSTLFVGCIISIWLKTIKSVVVTDISFSPFVQGFTVYYVLCRLRCQPTQMKYRDSGGKNRTGQLIRKGMRNNMIFFFIMVMRLCYECSCKYLYIIPVCTHEESETYYLIESLRSFQ